MRHAPLAACLALVASVAWGQVVLQPDVGVPGSAETAPSAVYDLTLQALAAGDYTSAADAARNAYQGGVRFGGQRWIDSIATAAVLGECLFELGSLGDAVARYEESLLVYAAHADWMLSVQFPPPALAAAGARAATWGRSERTTKPAAIPDTMSIRQRGADAQQVLQRGGVLSAAYDRPVRPAEIMRSLVIATYRTGALLGDLARDDAPLDAATKALMRRPAPPNHWSQSWIDIALGTAYWAQGKPDLASPLLTRGLVVGNQFDHPLTAWGLIVLGRIALDADQPQRAAKLFEEATYAAADFGDARALEEAFAWAAAAHRAAGTRGVPPTIRGGCDWARAALPALRARLLAIEAESFAAAGDTRSATAALKEIDGRLLRGDAGRGQLGGQAAYAKALVEYATGDVPAGDDELERALLIMRSRTPRLFQTARLADLVLGGSSAVSERQADTLFAQLLADPGPREVAIDPLGSLATLSANRTDVFETWLAVAARRGHDQAIEAAEATMRQRWLAAQQFGGRRVAVERLLAADPRSLSPTAAARRAAIVGERPDLAALIDRMGQLRGTLAAALQPGGVAAAEGRGDWDSYRGLAQRRDRIVAAVAAGRDWVPLEFPPLTSGAEIRRRLAPRQLILSFHWTKSGLFGLLESKDRFAIWQVRQAGDLPAEIKALVKSLGLVDPVAPVPLERIAAADWRGSAARVERMLFENSKVTLAEGIDELVIVPDGWLWYLPFELLPVGSGDESSRLLRDGCRIRYAPTRSLAVMRFEPAAPGPVGVHAGRMNRGDKPEVAEATLAQLTARVDRAVPLAGWPPAAASVCDTLVVFDELAGEGPVASWPLVPGGGGRAGIAFGDWLAPPLKRPQRVVLPGLQTAAAGGLAATPTRPGDDVFGAATDLIAAGARTAVVSRWRVGGKTCIDLMAEFLREASAAEPTPAADAWRRAVDLALAEPIDVLREPRLKEAAGAAVPDQVPPLLWAGYLLVDCGGGRYSPEPPPPAANAPAPPPPPALRQPAAPQARP